MRSAIAFGLTFIGDNIGRSFDAQLKGAGAATAVFIFILLFCIVLDVNEAIAIWRNKPK